MVRDFDQAGVGAARVSFRSGVGGALRGHPRVVRIRGVSLVEAADTVSGGSAVSPEHRLQYRVFADPVQASEQPSRGGRYPPRARDARLGDRLDMAARPVGRARQYPVPPLGFFRDRAPVYDHLAQLVIRFPRRSIFHPIFRNDGTDAYQRARRAHDGHRRRSGYPQGTPQDRGRDGSRCHRGQREGAREKREAEAAQPRDF